MEVEISFDVSTMCRILGVPNEVDVVPDINSWLVVPNFDPQITLRRLCKADS